MKRIILKTKAVWPLLLCFISLSVTCMKCADCYWFDNDSDKEIYVISDLQPLDNRISAGSEINRIGPHYHNYTIDRDYKNPWSEAIRDSMHLYILDAEKVTLKIGFLSEEMIQSIPQDAYLARITVLKHQIDEMHITYPPVSALKCVYYSPQH